MFSEDPRPDLFRLSFPSDFFEGNIMAPYNAFLTQKDYVFDSFTDVINESVQSFDIPVFGFQPVTQEQKMNGFSSAEAVSAPQQSIQRAVENQFSITLRHSEAYMTYWCMVEHLFNKYQLGPEGNRKPMDVMILELQDYKRRSIAKLHFEKVIFTGLDGLSLGYNQIERNTQTFTLTFAYTTFQPKFSIPELNLK